MMQDIDLGGKFNFSDIYGYKGASGGNPEFDLRVDLDSPMASVTLDRRDTIPVLERGFNESVEDYLVKKIEEKAKDLKGILTGFKAKYVELFRRDLRTIGYTETQLASVDDVMTIVKRQYKDGAFSKDKTKGFTNLVTPQQNIYKNYTEYLKILNRVDYELAISDPTTATYVSHASFGRSELFNERQGTELTSKRVISAGRIIARKLVELELLELRGLPRILRTNIVLAALSMFIVTGYGGNRKPPFLEAFTNRQTEASQAADKVLSDFKKRLDTVPGVLSLSNDLTKQGTSINTQQKVIDAGGGDVESIRYRLFAPLYNLFRSTNSTLGMSVKPEDDIVVTKSKIDKYMTNPGNKPEFLNYAIMYNSGIVDGVKPYDFKDPTAFDVTLPDNPDKVVNLILRQFANAKKGEAIQFNLDNRALPESYNPDLQYGALAKSYFENARFRSEIESALDNYFGIKIPNGEYNVIVDDAIKARRNDVYRRAGDYFTSRTIEEIAKAIGQSIK